MVDTTQRLQVGGTKPFLMVGFDRRFASATNFVRDHFAHVQTPVNVVYRVNAGRVPHRSWVSGDEGGGRILGEVCHVVDLCAYLVNAAVGTAGQRPCL